MSPRLSRLQSHKQLRLTHRHQESEHSSLDGAISSLSPPIHSVGWLFENLAVLLLNPTACLELRRASCREPALPKVVETLNILKGIVLRQIFLRPSY
jgi:hypothetical protein